MANTPRHILPVIVGAQFAGGSLWFAANAVLPSLEAKLGIEGSVGTITAAVQLGFIVGTALLAITGLADRFSARSVFLVSTLLGATANAAVLGCTSLAQVLGARFLVGVALAGIYPIGMKAASSWFRGGLGTVLGLLVGALVLGTAFPHLVVGALPLEATLIALSALATLGGVTLFALVPDGPHTRTAPRFDPAAIRTLLSIRDYRGSALGYFGHMWELYTFWAFLPALLVLKGGLPIHSLAFCVIAAGAIGCVVGGLLVPRFGGAKVAGAHLAVSGACCLVVPFALQLPGPAFVAFLLVWGIAVVGDSPQYSALSAQAAPPQLVGTALSFVTSVGFGLTVVSIELTASIDDLQWALPALAVGPLIGLWGLSMIGPASIRPQASLQDALADGQAPPTRRVP